MKRFFIVILGVTIILLVVGCSDLLRDMANIVDEIGTEETTDQEGDPSQDNDNEAESETDEQTDANDDESMDQEEADDEQVGSGSDENGNDDSSENGNEEEDEDIGAAGVNDGLVNVSNSGLGNYSGNISTQLGLYDVEGDWIYFANRMDGNKLYKINADGTDLTPLTDHEVYKIHVIDDWVYYIFRDANTNYGLGDYFQRVSTDGSVLEVLVDEPVSDLHFQEDRFYFVSDAQVRVMTLDGRFNNLPYQASNISISGEHLVFYGLHENENAYMLGSIYGREEQFLIHEGYGEFVLVGDQLFYTRGNGDEGIFKLQLGQTNSSLIIDDYIDFFNADENHIYYSTLESEASRETIRTDHNGKNKVSLGTIIYNINIFNSFIIGEFTRQGYYSLYLVDKETNAINEITVKTALSD